MMKRLVIYDSLHGNTGKIALAIAESIHAKAIPVGIAKHADLEGADVLVIGSPTHGGQASEHMKEFLSDIPAGALKNMKVAAFDTRFRLQDLNFALKMLVKTIGYAAPKMADILVKKGGTLLAQPEGFFVMGTKGPLADGELERARKWLRKR